MEVLEHQEARVGAEVPGRSGNQIHDGAAERLAFEGFLPGLGHAEQGTPHAHVRLEPLRGLGFDRLRELLADDVGRVRVGDPGDR